MDRRAPLGAGEAGARRLLLTDRKAVVDLVLTRAGWTDPLPPRLGRSERTLAPADLGIVRVRRLSGYLGGADL